MTIQTLFHQGDRFVQGTVEAKLLPGIPAVHVVGSPDASIKECGLKLKSAIRSLGMNWPRGHQIIINLRPMQVRKTGSGVELAVALAYLALTTQLSPEIEMALKDSLVYGELSLSGEIHAPIDLEQILNGIDKPLITGRLQNPVREGQWLLMNRLNQRRLIPRAQTFNWAQHWRRPEVESIELHAEAARDLLLAIHMQLAVLVAGPQGSGKSRWARLIHALRAPPEPQKMRELIALFGDRVLESSWLPLQQPHHSITPQAMIGGGTPLQAGIISRAHGGVLLMDEFLEFHPAVLESLREPIESGYVDLARHGSHQRFPADFQLVATTNLCPCGKLNPKFTRNCTYNLVRCRSVTARLSGPILDRFDMLVLTHEWVGQSEKWSTARIRQELEELQDFARARQGDPPFEAPEWISQMNLSHRRKKSMLRLARGLADLERSKTIEPSHLSAAFERVVTPMQKLREVFG